MSLAKITEGLFVANNGINTADDLYYKKLPDYIKIWVPCLVVHMNVDLHMLMLERRHKTIKL